MRRQTVLPAARSGQRHPDGPRLALRRIEDSHMHSSPSAGMSLGQLHEAKPLQKSDCRARGRAWVRTRGAGLISDRHLHLSDPPDGSRCSCHGADQHRDRRVFGAWAASLLAMSGAEHAASSPFQKAIDAGMILLMWTCRLRASRKSKSGQPPPPGGERARHRADDAGGSVATLYFRKAGFVRPAGPELRGGRRNTPRGPFGRPQPGMRGSAAAAPCGSRPAPAPRRNSRPRACRARRVCCPSGASNKPAAVSTIRALAVTPL